MSVFSGTIFYSSEASGGGSGTGSYITSGLIGYWDANLTSSYAGSGSTWYDISGRGYNMIFPSSSTEIKWVSGSPSSFHIPDNEHMSGSSNWAELRDLPKLYTEVTCFATVYNSRLGNWIFSNDQLNAGGYSLIYKDVLGSNKFYWQCWDYYNTLVQCYATGSANQQFTWYTVAFTFSWPGQQGVGYVDGGSGVSTNTGTTDQPTNNGTRFYIGKGPGGADDFSGSIANIMIYNRKLSQSEIDQNFKYLATWNPNY